MSDLDSEPDFFRMLDALHVFTGRGVEYAMFFVERTERAKEALSNATAGYGPDDEVPVERIAQHLDLAMRTGVS